MMVLFAVIFSYSYLTLAPPLPDYRVLHTKVLEKSYYEITSKYI